MKLMSKSLACGLAAVAIAAVGCSSASSTSKPTHTGVSSETGGLGLKLTLQGGQTLDSLAYTLSNGTPADTVTGTIPLGTGTAGAGPIVVATQEILPVVAATGYTISLTGTSTGTGPVVTCTGSAGPFAVTAGNETIESVLVTCTTPNTTGSVEVNATIQNCPTQGTLTAINSTATITAPGNTSTIFAAAVSPNEASLSYAFSVLSGTGTLSGQTTAAGNVSSSILFTCPAVGETDTIQVVTTDQVGAVCPASLTTSTVTVTCGSPPCLDPTVGTGIEATPNTAAGTCPAGQSNSLQDSSHNFCCAQKACFNGATQVGTGVEATPNTAAGTCPTGTVNIGLTDSAGDFCCSLPPSLSACTSAAQVTACATDNCVPCGTAATPAACTKTEALFVGIDIANGGQVACTPATATGCYGTMVAKSCLDHGHITGKECDDLGTNTFTAANGNAAPAVTTCLATLTCETGSAGASCATNAQGITTCLCGAANEPVLTCSALSSVTSFTGACDSLELNGFGPPNVTAPASPSAIITNYTDTSEPSGMANNIVNCAVNNSITQCGL